MTACCGPDWPSSAARPVRAVLPRQLTGRRAASLSRKRSLSGRCLPARRELSRALSQAQAQIRGAEPAPPPAQAWRCQHGSAARSLAPAPAPRPQHAPVPSPRRPARAATVPRRQVAHYMHGRAPSLAMRRPRARAGWGAANANPQQLRTVPAPTSRTQSCCRARPTCYRTATQRATQHSGYSRTDIRIILLTLGGAMGIRTPDLLHAMQTPPVATCGWAWPCVEFTCGFRGCVWPGVAWCRSTLAPHLAPRTR